MPSSGLGAYSVKINQLVFGGLFVLMVFAAIRTLMVGNTMNIQMLLAVSVLLTIVLAMDKYYWLLCPWLFFSSISIPNLPFNGREIGSLLFIGTFFIRSALHRDKSNPVSRQVLFSVPFFAWLCIIWACNPTGLAILGGDAIGGRSYFKVVLGFATYIMASKLIVTEEDGRYLFIGLVISNILDLIISARGFMVMDEYSGSLRYFLYPAFPLLLLLLCRYRLGQVISLSWRFLVALTLAGCVAYSGKRKTTGMMFIAPFLLMLFRRRDYLITSVCGLVGALVVGFVVAGHGSLYELPFSAQRALSFLPGRWDAGLEDFGFGDIFREEMKREAIDGIKSSPWVGRKGFELSRNTTSWVVSGAVVNIYSGHTYAGNWHNVWLGMAADFGIPALVFGILFSGALVFSTLRSTTKLAGGYLEACALFFGVNNIMFLMFAHVSGHTAGTPVILWVYNGFFIAMINGMNSRQEYEIPTGGLCDKKTA